MTSQPPAPFYAVLADFGDKLGPAWIERDPKTAGDRKRLIKDIADGQFQYEGSLYPLTILMVDPELAICLDVTAQVNSEARDLIRDREDRGHILADRKFDAQVPA